MMRTSDQIARREPSERNVAGSVVNQKSISAPLGLKALRLDCILLDPPRHKRGNNPPQMKVPCRQSPSTSVAAPRLRCHEARNTTTQTSTPRTSNESHGASQIAIASRKRRASSPPWGPIARRDRQLNTSSTGPSEKRLSTQTPGVGLLAPDRFSVLEHAHGDLGLGLDALNYTSKPRKRLRFLDPEVPSSKGEVSPQVLRPGSRPRSPKLCERVEQQFCESEEEALIADFHLVDIHESSSFPWVSTTIPVIGQSASASHGESVVFLPPGVSYIIESMKHGLAMEHAARQKAEERCEQETRLRVDAERQVAALEAEIARLPRALLATTATALASNLTRFSQSLSNSQELESLPAPPTQHHEASLVNRNPNVKGKARAGVTVTETV